MRIHVDTERVHAAGQKLLSDAQQVEDISAQLSGAIDQLDTWAWDGVSRGRAEPLLSRVRPRGDNLAQELEELGRKLVHVAHVFEREDSTAAQNLAGMPWVDFEVAGRLGGAPWDSMLLSGLPITGDDLANRFADLSIEEKFARLDKLDQGIADLQQRIDSGVVKSALALAILRGVLHLLTSWHSELEEAIAADPTPLVYNGPGEDTWGGVKENACVKYAEQRTGRDIDTHPSPYAKDVPNNYDHKVTLDGTEQDLRRGIKPGMVMVWPPPSASTGGWPAGRSPLYGVNDGEDFAPPPPGKYYDDVRYASHMGHVAVVEKIGRDYIVVSDQYGEHTIERNGRYWHNGPHDNENFLVGPTFVDLDSYKGH
jgi:uncharacterized protein YukE